MMGPKQRATSRVLLLRALCAMLFVSMGTATSWAQQSWTYTPYTIQVWFATEDHPEFTSQFKERLPVVFQQQSWAIAGATWTVKTADAPQAIHTMMLRNFESLTADQILASEPALTETDKLILVRFTKSEGNYAVAAREFDTRTRLFGSMITYGVGQRELLPSEAFRAATAAFSPIGRIEDVRGEEAIVRIRAGGLAIESWNPSAVQPPQVMFAVVRQNDRRGQARAAAIRVVEWTLLEVTESNEGNAKCRVHSMNKAYLGTRSSSRLERIAVGVKNLRPSTTIEIVTRDQEKRPLVGYYVYSKRPETKKPAPAETDGSTPAEAEVTKPVANDDDVILLGQTDWQGRIEVFPPEDGGMRMLYVRSGNTLLARLPLLAGQTELARAELVDDEIRLQAEALVLGIQNTLVDVEAQRQLLAARIRMLIKNGDLDNAQQLINQFRTLPTVADLQERIDRAKQSTASENNKVQARIDLLFAEVQELVATYVDPKLLDQLTVELSAARQQGGAAGSAPPSGATEQTQPTSGGSTSTSTPNS